MLYSLPIGPKIVRIPISSILAGSHYFKSSDAMLQYIVRKMTYLQPLVVEILGLSLLDGWQFLVLKLGCHLVAFSQVG